MLLLAAQGQLQNLMVRHTDVLRASGSRAATRLASLDAPRMRAASASCDAQRTARDLLSLAGSGQLSAR
jgi:hypothetical protein